MHGAWSALDQLIKKQNNAKYRKAKFRYHRQKKKEKFLKDHPYHVQTELKFPEVSKSQLEIIKKEIQRKARRRNLINLCIYVVASILVIYELLWLIVFFPDIV